MQEAESAKDWRAWLRAVRGALDAGVDQWAEDGIAIQRVSGGNNNALYRVEADGCAAAVKLCVADARQRAAREYAAMRVLRDAGLDLAPEPVGLDESCAVVPYPTVIYHWLAGQTLGPALTDAQLAALLASLEQMHALEPRPSQSLMDCWFHWFDFSRYLDELNDFRPHVAWLEQADPDGRELSARLARLVRGCERFIAGARVNPRRDAITRRLCRADTNLANAIWGDDGRVRWVDWEYSGWGDPALELAETRWHIALAELTPAQHAWLRHNYRRPPGDASFDERLAVWDRLITTRWAFLMLRALWSAHNGPDRVRLSRLTATPEQLRARLIQFVERAEKDAGKPQGSDRPLRFEV
jgi:aminoglycoside phosphotransferase (APT) family kinase protein